MSIKQNRPIHLIIHTQYYPPEIGAPQARLSELATHLHALGIEITVLTAMPNYPHGKLFKGYRGLLRIEEKDGIRIVRTAIYPSQSAKLLPRLANYFSFVFSSLLIGGWAIGRADYLLTESPPLFLGLSGFLLSRWKKAKWLFNVSDLWPESAVRLGVLNEGWALTVSQWLETFCYQQAFAITGQSKSILSDIEHRFPQLKTFRLSNGVDTNQFSANLATSDARASLTVDPNKLVAIYAGLHGLAQGLDQVLYAAAQLPDSNPIHIIFIGDGPEKQSLIKLAQELHLTTRVEFQPSRPKNQIPPLLASADIALVPLKLFLPGAVPSKLYEAMASNIPVLLIAEGEAADIVKQHQAGLVITPGDITGLGQALQKLAEDSKKRQLMGQNGRQAAEMQFDRSQIVIKFHSFLQTHQAS